MEGSKIKNIIILILLTVNLFLLVQVVDQERRSARNREETRVGAVEILARQNIAVRLDRLPEERSLPPMDVPQRDRAWEEAMAAALLGEALSAGEEGGPAAYRNGRGEGLFFSNGRFSFTFQEGIPLDGEEPEKHAVRLMKAAGYEGSVLRTGQGPEDGSFQVELHQLWGDEEIFNCGAVLTYRGGALRAVEGQRLTGTPTEAGDAAGLSVATVLIRFLGGIRGESWYLCSEIQDLRLGYVVAMEASGAGTLTPVWLVDTDGRNFYVNGMDGSLSVAE